MSLKSKKKTGSTMLFSEIINFQVGKKFHTILKYFKNVVD